MNGAARARAPADPQSGPSRTESTGFFHFALAWVRADPGSISTLRVSNYINRVGEHAGGRDTRLEARSEPYEGRDPAALRVASYVARSDRDRDASDELGAHVLISRGLPVTTGGQLARLLDARERKADRSYRCYGGRLPRVATHAIASFRYGVTPEQAGEILADYTQALSDRLLVPIEGQVHNKSGCPDHVHLLIGTRVVERGKLGRKQRALDAVAEKADGHAIDVGGRFVGSTMEWMRASWAARMRNATGDMAVDHRSYARRGVDIAQVSYVPRADIEYERRRGTTTWRDRRRRELAVRHPAPPVRQPAVMAEPVIDQAIGVQRPASEHAAVERRAEMLLAALARPATIEGCKVSSHDAGQALAGLLGLDVPGEAVAALLRQRSQGRSPDRNQAPHPPLPDGAEVRRRPEALYNEFLEPTAAGARPAASRGAAAGLVDPLRLDMPDGVLAELLRQPSSGRSPSGDRAPGASRLGDDPRPPSPHPVASAAPARGDEDVHARASPAGAGESRPRARLPGAAAPRTQTPRTVPGIASPGPSPVSSPSPRTGGGMSPVGSPGVADEGALTGRLDGRGTDKPVANPGAPAASHAGRRALPDAALRLPPGPPVHSDRAGPEASSGSRVDGQPKVDPPGAAHPDLSHAMGMFITLHQRRRLTAGRVEELAASIGMDRRVFEASARATDAATTPKRDDAASPKHLPQHLALCWQRWEDEDNEARKARRARAREQSPPLEHSTTNAVIDKPLPLGDALAGQQALSAGSMRTDSAGRRVPVGSDGVDRGREPTVRPATPASGSPNTKSPSEKSC